MHSVCSDPMEHLLQPFRTFSHVSQELPLRVKKVFSLHYEQAVPSTRAYCLPSLFGLHFVHEVPEMEAAQVKQLVITPLHVVQPLRAVFRY